MNRQELRVQLNRIQSRFGTEGKISSKDVKLLIASAERLLQLLAADEFKKAGQAEPTIADILKGLF